MLLSIVLTVSIIFAVSITYVGMETHNIVLNSAIENIEIKSEEAAKEVESIINDAIDTARTIAFIFEDYQTYPVEERRTYFNKILEKTLQSNPHFDLVWTA